MHLHSKLVKEKYVRYPGRFWAKCYPEPTLFIFPEKTFARHYQPTKKLSTKPELSLSSKFSAVY